MSTSRTLAASRFVGSPRAGFALIIVLAMVVLISVAIVAFIFSVQQNGQISQNAVSEQEAEVYSRGATQSIIASLQKEMAAGSGLTTLIGSSPTTPVIMPLTNNAVILPSRSVSTSIATNYASSINSAYSQYANLVKQSLPQAIYTFSSPSVTGPTCPATSIATSTASVDGRALDATYWALPQLVPGVNTTLTPLIPNWIYTARGGSNPTTFVATQTQPTTGASGTLNPNYVMGRYAYNIYDIGGLLNANVAGAGPYSGTAINLNPSSPSTGTPKASAPTPTAQLLVPGYKGSLLSADLTALPMNGSSPTLTLPTGATAVASLPANWQNYLPSWRAQGSWPTSTTSPTSTPSGFAYVLSGGEYSGWLNEIFGAFNVDPSIISPANPLINGSTVPGSSISNYHFTSRQDLINWVTNQWSYLGSSTNYNLTWTLPYLTQFSYDLDAPTYYPDPNRPLDATTVANGGNDATTFTDSASNTGDKAINPPFTSALDANGLPLVKRRFPLSALALVTPYYPGNEPAATVNTKQLLYDFGLYWVAGQGWVYSDWEAANGSTGTPSTKIKLLRDVPNTRSPNFFELIKAAVVAGSLGKQYGNNYDAFGGNQNRIQATTIYSSVDCQVIQIGANIISQAAAHYFPCDIQFNYNSTAYHFYGDKDLPYLYRTRLAEYLQGTVSNMTDPGNPTAGAARLNAVLLQAELWNPHAPNRVSPPPNNASSGKTTFPNSFRVIPNMTAGGTYLYQTTAALKINGNGKWGSSSQYTYDNSVTGNYTTCGGPNCSIETTGFQGNLTKASPSYIEFSSRPPAGGTGNSNSSAADLAPDLSSFREPCPIINATMPVNTQLPALTTPATLIPAVPSNAYLFVMGSQPGAPLTTVGASITPTMSTGTPYAGCTLSFNPVPSMYPTTSSPRVFGFLLGLVTAGPGASDGYGATLVMDAPMSLYLQYLGADSNWHTYDVIDSAMAPGSVNAPDTFVQTGWVPKFEDIGTRADPRSNRWGLLWDNRHGFSASNAYPANGTYSGSDYMGGMGPDPYHAGGDNFEIGLTGTPTMLFQGSLDAVGGGGAVSPPRGMVGVNTANSPLERHGIASGPSGLGWYGSFVPSQTGSIGFTATDYHYAFYPGYIQANQAGASFAPPTSTASNMLGSAAWQDGDNTCYADPDGVIRLGDSGWADASGNGLPQLMIGTTTTNPAATAPTLPDGTNPGTSSNLLTTPYLTFPAGSVLSNFDSRPNILNRPFQSVGELGYVFRGTPWRTLDFASPQSADVAMLDAFTAYGPDPWSYASSTYNTANAASTFTNTTGLVMGKVNLNTRQQPVLAAVLKGALINPPGAASSNVDATTTLSDSGSNKAADQLAQALTAWTASTDLMNQGPLRNRAELVGKYVSGSASVGTTAGSGTNNALYTGFSGAPIISTALSSINAEFAAIKQDREVVVRALGDIGTTRTWNLLIDLAVQTGHLTPAATDLQTFVVTGEKHVWVSVAIDRVTGKVIKMQVEPVRL